MIPVYVDGSFGMLHPATGNRGVLVLGSLGDEAMNAYRPLVFLADAFAQAGNPTLRLGYRGTGDSAGEDGEPDRFQRWLDGIAAGVRWLRETCGVGPVTLVGVRIGAAIAARAACAIDGVEALVLLSPLGSGRRFLREMILAAHTNAEIWQVAPHIEDGPWFEARGLRLDRAARDALDQLDIGKLPSRPAPRALVLDEPDSSAGRALIDRLSRSGTEVTHIPATGLAAMLRDPYENEVPHAAVAAAIGWHGSLARSAPASGGGLSALPDAELDLGTTRERPIRLGRDDSLLGILCEPMHRLPDAPVVLIANTGANPRYGNARVAVTVARWLAASGLASLRMDGAGIGDSALATGERGVPYAAQGELDVQAGLDALQARFAAPVVVLGMCSGAYHALQTAFDDPRIRGLMLVNLQKFVWQEGESLSVVQRTTFRTTRFYLRNVTTAATWQRLLHGEINVPGISRALAGRAARRVAAACDPLVRLLCRQETPVGRVRRQVKELTRRAVPILFVLSGNDPGLDELGEYFGAQGRHFRRLPNVTFHLLEGADHVLSTNWARQALMQRIAQYLHRAFNVPVPTFGTEAATPSRVTEPGSVVWPAVPGAAAGLAAPGSPLAAPTAADGIRFGAGLASAGDSGVGCWVAISETPALSRSGRA